MKKVAIMIDSEFGFSEVEAREKGFFFIPVVITIDGKEGYSGVDYTLEYIYDNLKEDTEFKTAASKLGMFQEEYRKALKDHEHVLFIGISKHLSSQINSARIAAEEDEFKGKVTVYDSEFIGPWLLNLSDKLLKMIDEDSELESFISILDKQRGNMFAWLFPKNLERLYASGRLSKAQYVAGSLLKITPVSPIVNGSLTGAGVIKTRSPEKAILAIVENTIEKVNELREQGFKVKILSVNLGRETEKIIALEEAFKESGYPVEQRTWLPAAIVGHVGIGGVGAGIAIDSDDDE